MCEVKDEELSEISTFLNEMKFKHCVWGVDEEDVLMNMKELDRLYNQVYRRLKDSMGEQKEAAVGIATQMVESQKKDSEEELAQVISERDTYINQLEGQNQRLRGALTHMERQSAQKDADLNELKRQLNMRQQYYDREEPVCRQQNRQNFGYLSDMVSQLEARVNRLCQSGNSSQLPFVRNYPLLGRE
jgi:septal ring factor EnvC (AmiA/AmiB activator)